MAGTGGYNNKEINIDDYDSRSNSLSGIYMIKNKINGKYYIGQSLNIKQRWWQHRSDYNIRTYGHLHLYNAFKKYGKDNFELIILEKCEIEELDEKEQYYIKKYDSCNREKGYNLEEGGGGRRGYKTSEETLEKLRRAHAGHAPTNNKAVYCIEKQLETDSIANMAKALQKEGLKAKPGAISNCLSGSSHTHLGLHFVYAKDKDNDEKINQIMNLRTNNSYKRIQCIETQKIYQSAAEVERDLGISRSCVRAACTGYRNTQTAGGYHWKYYEGDEING